MRVNNDFGNIIELSLSIIFKVSYFSVFFFLWVMIFALLYGLLGNTVDKNEDHAEDGEEYEHMSRIFKLFLYSLRNSIGDF